MIRFFCGEGFFDSVNCQTQKNALSTVKITIFFSDRQPFSLKKTTEMNLYLFLWLVPIDDLAIQASLADKFHAVFQF